MMTTREPKTGRPIRKVLFFAKSMSTSGTTRAIAQALRGEGMQVKWINVATWRRWLGEKTAKTWLRRLAQRFEPDLVFSFVCDIPERSARGAGPHVQEPSSGTRTGSRPRTSGSGLLEQCDVFC